MMTKNKFNLVIVGAKRTPFGANGGSLKDVGPTDLAVHASKAALAQSKVDPKQVDHVIFGNVLPATADTIYIPRHTGLKAGVPIESPSLGINRLCGTGFQVLVEAQQQMLMGDTEVALIGGVENMSLAPYVLRGARWGLRMGHQQASDMLTESLTDLYAQAPMAITAENLAEKYGISREQCDEFAELSQRRTKEAQAAGRFDDEIAPFEIQSKKGPTLLSKDEHPRAETTRETLAKLKPIFKKDGVVTAGNASGIVDGAAALVVTTEERAKREGWKPLARLVSYGISGCDPKIMGIGPAPASRAALKRVGMSMSDIDLIEVNEAFAPQLLAVEKELELDRSKLNVNGGAIAIGHPLAASGTRILMHLLYELKRRGKKYGLGSACIGGGQGISVVIESL